MGPGTNTTVSKVSAFNEAAFAKTYVDAQKAVLDDNILSRAAKTVSGHSALAAIDVDATIKGADVDTNLSAIVAGNPQLKEFVDVVNAHPDLKAGIDKVLKNEGQAGLEGFRDLMTGDGAINAADLKTMLNDPTRRGLVVDMLDAVGTDKFGMDYANRFIKTGLAASKNSQDPAAREAFLNTAKEAGIDPAAAVTSEVTGAFMGFLGDVVKGGNIQQNMKQLTDRLGGLGMSADALQSMQKLLEPLAGVFQFLFKDFAQFGMKWGPAMSEGASNIFADVQNVAKGFEQIETKAVETALPTDKQAAVVPTSQDKLSEEANLRGFEADLQGPGLKLASYEDRGVMAKPFETAALGVTIRQPEQAPAWTQQVANRNMGMSLSA